MKMAILCLTKSQPVFLTVQPMSPPALTLTHRIAMVNSDFGAYLFTTLSLEALFIVDFSFFSYSKA